MDPFEEMRRIRKEIDRMFNEYFSEPRFAEEFKEAWREPLCDFKDTEDALLLSIEIPGVNKENIEIKATENEIEVKAEAKKLIHEEKEGFYKRERSYKGFYRKMTLPCKIIPEQVQADYKDGVLEIKLPKKEKEKKKEAVKIQVK